MWFAISSLPPICYPSFSFIGGVAKEYTTKLGCEKYFRRSHNTKHRWRCSNEMMIVSSSPKRRKPKTISQFTGHLLSPFSEKKKNSNPCDYLLNNLIGF
jgi:hypothetical protein